MPRPSKPKRGRSPGADAPPPRAPLELLGGDAAPLRLILVGNNPSVATAAAGIPYAHGSNRFWHLLAAHVAPTAVPPTPDSAAALAAATGVGLLDVGAGVVGTHLSAFKSSHFAQWAPRFYARLEAHASAAAAAVGCSCGACGAPVHVATTGKRQWQELLVAGSGGRALPRVEYGRQPESVRPAGWPLPPSTQVWVLTSTSGAAALTNEARAAPWRELGAAVGRVAWPRRAACREA